MLDACARPRFTRLTCPTGTVLRINNGVAMKVWRNIDLQLWGWLGAVPSAADSWLPVAAWVAQWSWTGLLLLLYAVALREPQGTRRVLVALLAVLLAQGLARALAHTWEAPRPFMLGLSPNHLGHGWRGGFPSTHASVMFALAFSLWQSNTAARHWLLALLVAVLTAWARVYTGAHFPLDVLGGAVLGWVVASACVRGHTIVTQLPSALHRRFG